MAETYLLLLHADCHQLLREIRSYGFTPPEGICEAAAAAGAVRTMEWALDGLQFKWSGRVWAPDVADRASLMECARRNGCSLTFVSDTPAMLNG